MGSIKKAERAMCLDDHSLTGCVYSSILTKAAGVRPTQGKVTPASVLSCYNTLVALGFTGTPLNIINIVFDKKGRIITKKQGGHTRALEHECIEGFRVRFSAKHI